MNFLFICVIVSLNISFLARAQKNPRESAEMIQEIIASVNNLFDYIPIDKAVESNHGGRALAAGLGGGGLTLTTKSGLDDVCSNKLCLMYESMLSCKAFGFGLRKVNIIFIAKLEAYIVNYIGMR